jgi:hypothetical protein
MTRSQDDFAEDVLAACLAEARRVPPVPDPALLARIAADGAAAQARMDTARRRETARAPARRWSFSGFWPGGAALAGCLALGVGIGAWFEPDLTNLGVSYLDQTELQDAVLWSFDLALEEGV